LFPLYLNFFIASKGDRYNFFPGSVRQNAATASVVISFGALGSTSKGNEKPCL